MNKYLLWPRCHADFCPKQLSKGYLKLCGDENEKNCPKRDKNPYGCYDFEDIFLPDLSQAK